MGDVADSMRARERRTIRPGHLPDCFMAEPFNALTNYPWVCICERLRAAEQRVMKSATDRDPDFTTSGYLRGKRDGRREGVKAAREAERVETGELIVQMLSTNTIVSIWLTSGDAVRRQEAEFIFHRIRQTVQRNEWFPEN